MPEATRTRLKNYLSKYGGMDSFLAKFAPDTQAACAKFPEACVLRDCPTLVDVRNMYGRDAAELWLSIELRDISEYGGAGSAALKPTAFEIDECARTLYSLYYHLKLSELLLFFAKLKGGAYGKFYGKVDLLMIGEAMQKFLKYRDTLIRRAEEKARAAAKLAEDRTGCCTREQYNGMERVKFDIRIIKDTEELRAALKPKGYGANGWATVDVTKDQIPAVIEYERRREIVVRK